MNNRQASRRRGRGNNNRAPSGGNRGGFDYQNRVDNRARGNASQMLEKYKKLAHDAQMNGDRVNAEYYFQFADHYFRVLADFRTRQEARQDDRRGRDRDQERGTEDEFVMDAVDEGSSDSEQASYDESRDERYSASREESHSDSDAQDEDPAPQQRHVRSQRAPRPRGERPVQARSESGEQSDRIDSSLLPPSISLTSDGDEEKVVRKPRARRPRLVTSSETPDAAE